MLRGVARSGECALTVYAPEFHIPWRMLYTHPHETEELAEDGANFDPAGFWGYQHVIEQFINILPAEDGLKARIRTSGTPKPFT